MPVVPFVVFVKKDEFGESMADCEDVSELAMRSWVSWKELCMKVAESFEEFRTLSSMSSELVTIQICSKWSDGKDSLLLVMA